MIHFIRQLFLLTGLVLIPFSLSAQSVKGQSLKVHTIRLGSSEKKKTEAGSTLLFAALCDRDSANPEMLAACRSLEKIPGTRVEWVRLDKRSAFRNHLKEGTLLWIHGNGDSLTEYIRCDREVTKMIMEWLTSGGRLVLSGFSVHLLNHFGLENVLLQDSLKFCRDDGYGRKLGFHAFLGHPLFEGLNGGAYLLRPERDLTVRITGFFGNSKPGQGKVIAVDWDYIFLREETRLVMEYDAAAGRVIAVGGYLEYAEKNLNNEHLDRFTQNVISYLQHPSKGEVNHWFFGSPEVISYQPGSPEQEAGFSSIPLSTTWSYIPGEMDLIRDSARLEPWDLAGERLVIMGSESGGIEEVWAHPFMAFRDYEAGIMLPGSDTLIWLSSLHPRVTVTPYCLIRDYHSGQIRLREIIVADPDQPAGVIHYELEEGTEGWLTMKFRSNIRLMWPYSSHATGVLYHGWTKDPGAYLIKDRTGRFGIMLGANQEPVRMQRKQGDGFIVDATATWKLESAGRLDVVFATTTEGEQQLLKDYKRVMMNPQSVYTRSLQHHYKVQSDHLMLTTPDHEFNKGYRWAVTGTDRFFVHTPGMGRALVAGYSTTRRGWDGGQKVSGRPGYAWYFGRDGEWSGMALLATGDFEKVRHNLGFFRKYQDLNGKILHEASTSGFIHYDAADATPLYIILAGRYFRHSFDTNYLRLSWPSIKLALDYCFSTDTDGDHLIENTNVGHGWVEGGKLYGSHTTLYMTGCWAEALKEAGAMAKYLGDADADRYLSESRLQRELINQRFWQTDNQFFSYGMDRDGSFRRETTILPSVPLLFGLCDEEQAQPMLKTWASNRFTTNWGVRILGDDSPWFKPTGYHYGSVWPLFTGWTSLAAYKYGNDFQGFSNIMNNLLIYRNWSLGFVEEVMNGAEYKPSGVCPHQCWSETMVTQPIIEGMLGFRCEAPDRRITLAPAFPAHWDSLHASGIRAGESVVNFDFCRDTLGSTFTFIQSQGAMLSVEFQPLFPAGTQIDEVLLNGISIPFQMNRQSNGLRASVSFPLEKQVQIRILHKGGIAVLPVVSHTKPGDTAAGLRIISAQLTGRSYIVDVEGPAGSTSELNVYYPDSQSLGVENATAIGKTGRIGRYRFHFESAGGYQRKQIIFKMP